MSVESEHPRVTNREIIFEKNSNLCDHNPQTLQTDRQTTLSYIAIPQVAYFAPIAR